MIAAYSPKPLHPYDPTPPLPPPFIHPYFGEQKALAKLTGPSNALVDFMFWLINLSPALCACAMS